MKRYNATQKVLITLYITIVLLFCHHFIFRPTLLDWGAPEKIRAHVFSGDDITHGTYHTRAVLVNATPEQLWPWLLQMGQERGGFYSYQWLENLFFADMKNRYELRPELQCARIEGDTIWLASRKHWNAKGFQIIAQLKPQQAYVMVGDQDFIRLHNGDYAMGAWAFYLYPENNTQTWLVARSAVGEIRWETRLMRYFLYEVPHAIMEIRMLQTIKRLAEGHRSAATWDCCANHQTTKHIWIRSLFITHSPATTKPLPWRFRKDLVATS